MKDRFQRFNSGRVMFFLLAVITCILFGAVLKITSAVLLPFTIAVLLALVTSPIIKFLEKFRVPRIISVLLVILFLIAALGFIGMFLFSSGRTLLTLYPRYEVRITEIYIHIANFFELPYDEHLSIFDNIWGQLGVRNRVRLMTISLSNAFLNFLTDAFMVAIFMVFLVFEAVFFRKKLDRAFDGPGAVKIKTISKSLITQVTHYLSIMFFVSLLNGVLAGVGLMIIGVEFAVIWGIIQFVLNFIPNIGSIAVGVAATAFAVIQFWPQPGPIAATALVMLVVNIFCGFIIMPKAMGDKLGLSPLVVLVSLMIWGYLWGFAGLILAVPMMAIIKIVCENISVLEPISILMGSHKAVMTAESKEAEEKESLNHSQDQPPIPDIPSGQGAFDLP